MQHAQYELIENGAYFGTIPGFEGLWANASTQQDCEKELRDALEGWILLGISMNEPIPVVDGVTVKVGYPV
jgi:predicted RNase H-like HicB family nuclease